MAVVSAASIDCLIVRLAPALGCKGLANQRRQRQAAGMGGENAIDAALHYLLILNVSSEAWSS